MKVAVECQSPLLQKSLEVFLKNYISSSKKSDLVVRDEACVGDDKRCFYIGSTPKADLVKPFSKSQLILALERRYKELYKQESRENEKEILKQEYLEDEGMDFSILEKRIDALTQEYKANILRAVKAFYEK
jgi:hypothetical protein